MEGHDLATETGKRGAKAILGYLPQELGMYPELTAAQFVDYMAILKGLDEPRQRARRVAEVLEMVALKDAAHRKIKGFSGGMKRRVGIAQALVNDPKVLIVDEPTAGLDPEERIRFRNLLVNLAADRTVILSTHIVEDIGQTCRDIAVLGKGRGPLPRQPRRADERRRRARLDGDHGSPRGAGARPDDRLHAPPDGRHPIPPRGCLRGELPHGRAGEAELGGWVCVVDEGGW